jgi:2-polyprenyl-6-methoxyphenol hydroxylase-like FAD-dependent oxidoreductase
MTEIAIAGGGIAGLAAALGLAGAGARVLVLERAPSFGELGAGLQLGPNAFRALRQLGVDVAQLSMLREIDELRLMHGVRGQMLGALPLRDKFRARFGHPYAVAHRKQLHGLLLEACGRLSNVRLRSAAGVQAFHQDGAGVTVTLDAGEQLRCDALLGADGLRSVVRYHLLGDGEPRLSGHLCYRALVDYEQFAPEARENVVTLWAAPHAHVVHYPLAGSKQLNLVATRNIGACSHEAGVAVSSEEVRAAFADFAPLPRDILRRAQNWRKWTLCDREPVSVWCDRRVALVGDAAHPMLQYAAQGACMALEDAVCIAHELGGANGDPAPAFARYNAQRWVRTARVQLASRQMGEAIYHAEGARAAVRDAMVAELTEDALLERLSWLYGGPRASEVHGYVG